MSGAVRLSRPLVLEQRVETPDAGGGRIGHWQALCNLWGEIRAGSAGRADGEERQIARMRYKIYLRGAPAGSSARPMAGQRLREGARAFTILAVTDGAGDGRYLLCHCEEEALP